MIPLREKSENGSEFPEELSSGRSDTSATRDDSAKENLPPLSAEMDGAGADVIVKRR